MSSLLVCKDQQSFTFTHSKWLKVIVGSLIFGRQTPIKKRSQSNVLWRRRLEGTTGVIKLKTKSYPHQRAPEETEGQSAWCAGSPAFPSSARPPPDPPRTDQTLAVEEKQLLIYCTLVQPVFTCAITLVFNFTHNQWKQKRCSTFCE